MNHLYVDYMYQAVIHCFVLFLQRNDATLQTSQKINFLRSVLRLRDALQTISDLCPIPVICMEQWMQTGSPFQSGDSLDMAPANSARLFPGDNQKDDDSIPWQALQE